MSDKKHRMYADFSEEAYEKYQKGDAVFNNGFRDKKGYFDPDQPEFHEIEDDDDDDDDDDYDYDYYGNYGGEDVMDGNEALGQLFVALGALLAAGAGYAFANRKKIKSWVTHKAHVIKRKFKGSSSKESETELAVVPNNFSTEVDTVLNEYAQDVNNEDAQKKLLEIMELAALLAKKIREFSGAYNADNPDYLEIRDAFEKLTTEKTTEYINAILENNPTFLEDNGPLSEIFRDHYREKEYVPIQNDDIRKALSLTASE